MIECNDDNPTGQICKEVSTLVNIYANQIGSPYEEVADKIKKDAFHTLVKKGSGNPNVEYTLFVPGSGYGDF